VLKKDGMTEKSKGKMLEAERLKVEKKNLVAAFGDNHRILLAGAVICLFQLDRLFLAAAGLNTDTLHLQFPATCCRIKALKGPIPNISIQCPVLNPQCPTPDNTV
jgi:hypothetical protein